MFEVKANFVLSDFEGTGFYTNCKRQRKGGATICRSCPFRWIIEELEDEDKEN